MDLTQNVPVGGLAVVVIWFLAALSIFFGFDFPFFFN